MSRGVEAFNLARTAYTRLIPHLSPAVTVGLAATVGSILAGPAGTFAGAGAGVALTTELAQTIVAAFRAIILFIQENPIVSAIITTAIFQLERFIRGEPITQHEHQEN